MNSRERRSPDPARTEKLHRHFTRIKPQLFLGPHASRVLPAASRRWPRDHHLNSSFPTASLRIKPQKWPTGCFNQAMHPSTFIGLLEEMVDIKVQQQTEAHLKTTPEVAAVLHQKRETDKRRLDQIRAELIRILSA
jgi:hypothetical protein